MQRSDESWDGVKGRQYVTLSTLLEYAIVFGLSKFLEVELQSYLTNSFKTSQLGEDKSPDPNMIYRRLLYAAATGGSVAIAESLMVWGTRLDPGLRCMSDALSRAIYRGNFGVASVLCKHGALSNVPGVYLEGFRIQSLYRKPDIWAMRFVDLLSQLEASPVALMASLQTKYSVTNLFGKCADFNPTATLNSVDCMARLAKWNAEIAIDDFAVAFSRPYRIVRSGVMVIDRHTGEAVSKRIHTKKQETYVMDEATDADQGGGSLRFHVLTVKLLPVQDIQSSLAILMDYKAAYGRLPKLDITPYNLTSSASPDLTKRLLDLGYSVYEHHRPRSIVSSSFSMTRLIPSLAGEEAGWN